MAHKIFVSFLGTTNYKETHYQFENRQTERPVRFIQEALLRMLYWDWTAEDKVLIFYTSKSKEKNWLDSGQKTVNNNIDKIGLKHILDGMKGEGFQAQINDIEIPEGFSEQEVWNIFNIVYENIDNDSEIYFDITHAFRSIPFFSVALFNYAGFLKSTKLKQILYGAFEKLGSIEEFNNLPKEKRIAPVISLNSIIELQRLVIAADNFKQFGKVGKLTSYLGDKFKSKSGNDPIFLLKKNMNEFEKRIATCRGKNLIKGDAVCNIKKNINAAISTSLQPFSEILKFLEEEIEPFAKDSDRNIEYAIHWCIKYNMIQQAYTLGQEYIVTIVCKKMNQYTPFILDNEIEGKDKYKDFREYISSILGMDDRDLKNDMLWKGFIGKYRDLSKAFFNLEWVQSIRKSYQKLTRYRNQINHGGFIGDISADDIINNLEKPLSNCLEIVNRETLDGPNIKKPTDAVFINLSNHPYTQWGEKQKQDATSYGECIDLLFPDIDSSADIEAIDRLANEYLEKIRNIGVDKRVTVHLMGEMNFTYLLLQKLQKLGIHCVASTSNRNVEEISASQKEIIFNFIRFRDYFK